MAAAERAFLDTNVLVYALDAAEPDKQPVAAALVARLLDDRAAVISVQVLRELYVIVTRKIAEPLSPADARAIIDDLLLLPVVEETPALFTTALDLVARHRFSLWDALILAAAKSAGCDVLYTEDLSHGQVVLGVRIADPFVTA